MENQEEMNGLDQEFETVEEGTAAADSLKPNSKPAADPKSKLDAINGVVGMMSGMDKGNAVEFFNKVMAQFGPGKDYGVGDNSGKNSATIDSKNGAGPKTKDAMPKLNVKEDLAVMFEGQDLSEEFQERAETLFEAAVNLRLTTEVARLEEAYAQTLNEELETLNEEISNKLEAYLEYVVENWMKENEVAIESTLRNELSEEFMEGLKNLFAEHYISVPEEKIDVLEAMAEKVSALEEKLNEAITENSELKGVLVEEAAQNILEEVAADLALTQQEKFAALAEGIEFDGNLETYEKKLKIIKETYFSETTSYSSSNIEEETFEGGVAETVNTNPAVSKYVQAIARTIKK